MESDYHLKISDIKLTFKHMRRNQPARMLCKLGLQKVKDIVEIFKISLGNKFEALHSLQEEDKSDVDKLRSTTSNMRTSACKQTFGWTSQSQKKEWISLDTQLLIEERRKLQSVHININTQALKFKAQKVSASKDNFKEI